MNSADTSSWHPWYRAMWEYSARKPGADLSHPWGHAVFRVRGQTFVYLGDPARPSLTIKPYPGSRDVLVSQGLAAPSRYIGRFGWVTMPVSAKRQLRLALDLIDESYEHMVPAKVREAVTTTRSPRGHRSLRGAGDDKE